MRTRPALLVVVLLALTIVSANAADRFFPLGVWYEGGVGAFRDNLIPDDPIAAAKVYNRDFADIAAHGCNTAVVPNTQPNHHKVILDAAQAHGLRLIIELNRSGGELGEMIRGGKPLTDGNIRQALDTNAKPIISHPALLGIQLLDEPWPPSYERYARIYAALKAYAPDLVGFTCLPGVGNIDNFLTTAKPNIVASDDYPIRTTPVVIKDPMMDLERTINAACVAGAKHNARVWAVLQAHAIDGYHPFPTAPQIRCQTYLALASGCKGIYWFMYQSEYYDKSTKQMMYGLVDANGKGDDRWAEIGKLTREIRKLEPILLDLVIADESIKVKSNVVTHTLKDPKGRIYVFAVNTDTILPRAAKIELNTPIAGNRVPEVIALRSGKHIRPTRSAGKIIWSQTLAPGDGALYAINLH